MSRLEFFFDCSSPWTYLAFHNIQPLIAKYQVEMFWRPILVGGIFNSINPSVYESRERPVPAKAAYGKKDLADWAEMAGIKILHPPSIFPVNSVKAMRGCILADRKAKLVDYATAVFEAYWGEDQDISRDEVLAEIALRVGLDPAEMAAGMADQQIKDELRANTEELIKRGGFGSPTMFLNGGDMYFGNDRLVLLERRLSG